MGSTAALEGREYRARAGGGEWSIGWHRPTPVPEGTPHGANAFCVTPDGDVVLITEDGERWGWPGGRPEPDETWERTLRREVMEEACARVGNARLLGFCRAVCVSGPDVGLVLVRSIWRADVILEVWQPRFEILDRRVVTPAALLDHLWMEEGFEPIYHRALAEAGLRHDEVDSRAR